MNAHIPPSPFTLRSRVIRMWPVHAYFSAGAVNGLAALLLPTSALVGVNALCIFAVAMITMAWVVVLTRGNATQDKTALDFAAQLHQEGLLPGLRGYRGEIQTSPAHFQRMVAPIVLAVVLLFAIGRVWPDLWIRASSLGLALAYLGSALAASHAEVVRADTILCMAVLQTSQSHQQSHVAQCVESA